MRQLEHSPFCDNNLVPIHLWWREIVQENEKAYSILYMIGQRSSEKHHQKSKMELLAKKVNGIQPLIIFVKKLHPRCLSGFWMRL